MHVIYVVHLKELPSSFFNKIFIDINFITCAFTLTNRKLDLLKERKTNRNKPLR